MTHAPLPATAQLWAQIAGLLDLFVRAFGTAARLMAQHTLPRRDARDGSRWLADIEATVRRLLYAEAVALALPAPATRASRAPPPRPPTAQAIAIDPYAYRDMMLGGPTLLRISGPGAPDAAHWKVHFKLDAERAGFAGRDRAPSDAPAAATQPCAPRATHVAADRLARRLEAVRRVIADPSPWVRRLARLLHRRPRLAARLAQPVARRWRTPCGAALPATYDVVDVELRRRE